MPKIGTQRGDFLKPVGNPGTNGEILNHDVVYVGVDPGGSGGVCYIIGNDVACVPTPNDWETFRLFRNIGLEEWGYRGRRAVIEWVRSSPQMGVASAFTFGCNYGKLLMALTAVGISFEEVRPQVWQKALLIPPRRKGEKKKVMNKKGKEVIREVGGESDTEFKDRLRQFAQRLFPNLDAWNQNLTYQRAVCDSILIAEYCRRKHEGKL